MPRSVHAGFVRRAGNIDEICLPSVKDLLVVDVKSNGRDVQLGQFLRTVLGGRHRKDDAVDVAVSERGDELGRELLADADELEIPVELVLCDVAQEAAELSASGFACEPEGDDNALGPLWSHGNKYIRFPPNLPLVLLKTRPSLKDTLKSRQVKCAASGGDKDDNWQIFEKVARCHINKSMV